jgi:hypothetical protein
MTEPFAAPPPPPPPMMPPPTASASTQAVVALVLGILGVGCCGLAAPFAWYVAVTEQRAIREGRSSSAGAGMAGIAKILGMIGSALLIFGLMWIFFAGGMAILQGMAHSH